MFLRFLNFDELLFVSDEQMQEVVDKYDYVVGWRRTSALTQEGVKDCFDFAVDCGLGHYTPKKSKNSTRLCTLL